MNFAVYSPDESKDCPLLYFLSGITCTEQNFIQKSGFQKFASENQIAVVVPDTSPRGEDVPE
jgi:S-formylglutathione hydrolase